MKNCDVRKYDKIKAPIPDKEKFKIIDSQCFEIGNFVIVTINYPNCTNFEGLKIIVYELNKLEWIKEQVFIDPHFDENRNIIARFQPTAHGMFCAKKFCETMINIKS